MTRLLCSLTLATALVACDDTPTAVDPEGNWGGEGLLVQVTAQGATLEFDCATGTIDVPFVWASDGSFRLTGTFTLGTGGPVMEGHEPEPQPAVYSGQVTGDRMRIGGTFGDDDTPIGPHTVRKGQNELLRRCL